MPRQTPQVDPVHHAVQYVDQLRGGHGQSQGHDIAGDAPSGKIMDFPFHHLPPPMAALLRTPPVRRLDPAVQDPSPACYMEHSAADPSTGTPAF